MKATKTRYALLGATVSLGRAFESRRQEVDPASGSP